MREVLRIGGSSKGKGVVKVNVLLCVHNQGYMYHSGGSNSVC